MKSSEPPKNFKNQPFKYVECPPLPLRWLQSGSPVQSTIYFKISLHQPETRERRDTLKKGKRDRQEDREIYGKIERQTGRQRDRQEDREIDRQREIYTGRERNIQYRNTLRCKGGISQEDRQVLICRRTVQLGRQNRFIGRQGDRYEVIQRDPRKYRRISRAVQRHRYEREREIDIKKDHFFVPSSGLQEREVDIILERYRVVPLCSQ